MVYGLVMWNDHVEKSKGKGITEHDSENVTYADSNTHSHAHLYRR